VLDPSCLHVQIEVLELSFTHAVDSNAFKVPVSLQGQFKLSVDVVKHDFEVAREVVHADVVVLIFAKLDSHLIVGFRLV